MFYLGNCRVKARNRGGIERNTLALHLCGPKLDVTWLHVVSI